MEVPFSARFLLGRSGRNPDGMPVGGLQMSRNDDEPTVTGAGPSFVHVPVMVDEVVALLASVPPGVVLDATVGGGGHARAILDRYPALRLIGLDQDADAVAAARRALAPYGARAVVERARFDRLGEVLDRQGVAQLSAVLFDLGVSSPQLDRPERGFTFRVDAPLDMRMDQGGPMTAADVVNTLGERDLVRLLVDNGEGRFAGRVARAIIAARPLTTTAQLAEVVRDAIPAPARRRGGHPARRLFQGLRIAVNQELAVLPVALGQALDRLAPGGRAVVLAYHSGEDRLVKRVFSEAATGGCICPPTLPCQCGATPTVRLLTRGARKPAAAEVAANPRSESARLRAAERLAPSPRDPEENQP
jgi:16S rRNA (cytosine1402-N4)-methyltransferase